MDLRKSYWQLLITQAFKTLIAFETPKFFFQFKTMSLGLVNARTLFCRMMCKVFQDVIVDSFVDDIRVFTQIWREHMMPIVSI